MGNITIQGDLTGDVPGGEVGGASNLTTVGAIPYVSASGTLNQDPTKLFWDSANSRLGVGTNAPGVTLHLTSPSTSSTAMTITNTSASGRAWTIGSSGSASSSTPVGSLAFYEATLNGIPLAIYPSGNVILRGGLTGFTDSNYALEVARSGTTGTLRVYDQTPTTGSTKVVVRAGGGQGTSALVSIQDGAASEVARLTDNVNSPFRTYSAGTLKAWFGQNAFMSNSAGVVGWTPTGDANASPDLSLSRASAGVLQVGDGGSNALGQVNARAVNSVNTLVAYNSTGGIFMAGNAGSSWGTMQSYSDGAGTAKATAINPNGGNVLVGTTTDDGTNKLQVAGTAIVNLKAILKGSGASRSESAVIFSDSTGAEGSRRGAIGSEWFTTSGQYGLEFVTAGSLRGGIAYTSGNLIWGSSTYVDNGYKLDVAASGASGTLRVYDATPTTGVTKAVIRAGAGQGATNLTEWQDSAGTAVADLNATGGITTTSFMRIGAGSYFGWLGRAYIYSPASGVLTFYNGAENDFNRLQFGGTTSSFPALKRNGNSLDVRLADDSAYAALQAVRLQTAAQTVSQLPAAAAGNAGSIQYVTDANATTIGSTVAGGGANKVLVWSNGTAWKIFAN